jgi:hypothetical protein
MAGNAFPIIFVAIYATDGGSGEWGTSGGV